ncbi:hypothetical protein BIW11_03196 [Tropilaelaps mercedesae]|uniref:TIMELESS-interacting protein n=1 Tax=Tropilaelaps mercedesae TaxID=418985 RepID=A0A1V9XQM9_9ACAR|nr:hypothetical protein BIW11_03196 [Tropilaelaps mercedesae]
MSGRNFRIISDSEDDVDDIQKEHKSVRQQIAQSDSEGSDKNGNVHTSDIGNLEEWKSLEKKGRRPRIASGDEGETSEEENNGRFIGGNRNELPVPTRPSNGNVNSSSEENDNDDFDEDNNDINQNKFDHNQSGSSCDQRSRRHDQIEGSSDEEKGNGRKQDEAGPANDIQKNGRGGANKTEEVPIRTVVRKRVVKNPQPKLDVTRLTGERGLGRLRKMHPHIKFKGKGHEREDLRCVLHHLQLWGHRMYPRMQMKDIFERCERLGTKLPLKIYLRKMRTGQIYDFCQPTFEAEDNIVQAEVENNDDTIDEEEADGRMRTGEHQKATSTATEESGRDLFEELMAYESQSSCYNRDTDYVSEPVSEKAHPVISRENPELDDEVRARIEAKRLEALRKREKIRKKREGQIEDEELMFNEIQNVEVD